MTDKPIHVKPGLYTIFYEALKVIAKQHGYNLLINGSMNRDMDLVAVPWIDEPKPELEMVQAFDMHLRGRINANELGYSFSVLPGGRHSYIINLNRGDKDNEWFRYNDAQYYLDISITPIGKKEE